MAVLSQTRLVLATLILTVFCGIKNGEGLKQELRLEAADGNALYFRTSVPDLSKYSSFLPEIKKYCVTGIWFLSSSVNYQTYRTMLGRGLNPEDPTDPANFEVCGNLNNAATLKSLRHFGASDTDTAAISLYSGRDFNGNEIVVAAMAKTDISTPIGSIAATGTMNMNWMLYEGKSLDGNKFCLKVPSDGYYISYKFMLSTGLTKIGSIFKGCDPEEIRLYKKSHLL